MVEKKTEIKEKKELVSKEKSGRKYAFILIGIVLAIIIIFGYLKFYPKTAPQEDTIVAAVNGESITLTELNKVYDSMPQQLKLLTAKEDILDKIIEERLIYQEAKKEGIIVDEEDAEAYLAYFKQANGLTDEKFNQILIQQNMTEDELIEKFIVQLTVQQYINETFISKIEVGDEEIRDYYNENKEAFKLPEQVTVRHILIGDKDMTAEEKNETAAELLNEINKDNFCEYVTEYSSDSASVPDCGEYTFGKNDQYVQEFKDFSFSNSPGKIGIAETQFGAHIIYIVKKTPAKTLQLSEVRDQIKNSLVMQSAQEDYKSFYEELLSKNVVNIYYQESIQK